MHTRAHVLARSTLLAEALCSIAMPTADAGFLSDLVAETFPNERKRGSFSCQHTARGASSRQEDSVGEQECSRQELIAFEGKGIFVFDIPVDCLCKWGLHGRARMLREHVQH